MAQAEIKETIPVDIEPFYRAITSYDKYPGFVEGCTQALVTRTNETQAKVDYKVSMMKDISYSLEHFEDPAQKSMNWKLISSDFMKKNTGSWNLRSVGPGQTEVNYRLEIEFSFPVPSLILNRLIKGQLPGMIKNFTKLAQSL